jgi:branched-chain amino acid transport system substrate-binding protein
LALASIGLLGALVACTDGGDDTAATTLPEITTTLPAAVQTDGRLVIGVLLPAGDALLSAPLQDAVDAAVEQVNLAGGVLDQTIRVRTADEGQTSATATTAIRSLIDADVDAIIGPTSSLIALGTLDEIVGAGKVACSPTASALALDGFPDDGLFFRTVPSDSLQARAIAQMAEQTGAQRAVIIHVDDAYGRGFAAAVESSLTGGAITTVEAVPIAHGDDDLGAEFDQVSDADPQVVIVLADSADGPRILAALDDVDTAGIATVIVNDAMRNPAVPQTIADLRASLRQKILGIAPQAQAEGTTPPFDPPGPFATNAYDCVNLIALAAVLAGSDAPRAIADEMAEVSAGGSPCAAFAGCIDTLAGGFQIDYNGPSGLTEIQSRTGDTQRAVFDRFTFSSSGTSVFERLMTVSY